MTALDNLLTFYEDKNGILTIHGRRTRWLKVEN